MNKNQSPQNLQIRQEKIDHLVKTAKQVGVGALALGASYLIAKKIVKGVKKHRSQVNFTTEAQQAVALRGAMNRSGMNWLHWMDGTDTETLYQVAQSITNIKKVAKEYQNLYNRVLVDDLRKELTTGELTKFNAQINKTGLQIHNAGNNGMPELSTQSSNPAITGSIILLDKPTPIYKNFTWYPFGSVKKTGAMTYIPYPVVSLKEVRLNLFQKIPFLEVRVNTIEGHTQTIYVAQAESKLVQAKDIGRYAGQYTAEQFTDEDF